MPAAVVSGRLSPRSFRRYRRVRGAVAPMLASLSLVGAGSEEEAERFRELGALAERVVVTGNLKYDLEGEPLAEEDRSRAVGELGLETGRPLLVAGSTGEGEEALVLAAFERVAERPAWGTNFFLFLKGRDLFPALFFYISIFLKFLQSPFFTDFYIYH